MIGRGRSHNTSLMGPSEVMTEATVPAAKFCSRTAAFLIDMGILLMILGTVSQMMVGASLFMSSGHVVDRVIITGMTGLSLGLGYLWFIPAYFIVFHTFGGATPGKSIMGIKVVSTQNRAIRPGISFLRVIGYLLSGLPMVSGFLWVLFDRNGEAWHDKLAGTRVIYS